MKRTLSMLAALALSVFAVGQPAVAAGLAPDAVTARTLPGGGVVGYVDAATGAHAWRAIPFAAPKP